MSRASRWARAASLVLAAIASPSIACEAGLSAVTLPPPGKVAEFDPSTDRVRLSKGVALAFACDACVRMTSSTGDATIVTAHSAAPRAGNDFRPLNRPVVIVVARTPGRTEIEVHTDQGDRSLRVDVID